MSWMYQLLKTYENNLGKESDSENTLTPLAHMYAKAQLEVTLDAAGHFVSSSVVEKQDAVTLIPVSEKSAGRSRAAAPHPLCDTLSYLAGDYADYCANVNDSAKAKEKYTAYINNLHIWSESVNHPKVNSVFNYLDQGKLISDLVSDGKIVLDEAGKLSKNKLSGNDYEKVLVRFRVIGIDETDALWKDSNIINAYTNYYLGQSGDEKDICYLLGHEAAFTENHPKGIVAANYGAKLISANDSVGFTFRGRFLDSKEAYCLSYEASQKIHSALTWLVKTQGVFQGSKDRRTFVCWNSDNKKVPDPIEFDIFSIDDTDAAADSGKTLSYRKQLSDALQGYRCAFDQTDVINVIALDAATTGRLSITFYDELPASIFIGNMEYWGSTLYWKYFKKVKTPALKEIVNCAFGVQRNQYIETDDRVLKEQVQRLAKCMLDRQPFPWDIKQALVKNASYPLRYESSAREYVLATACAVINKYKMDRNELDCEGDHMQLDKTNNDRSYLFGRLLAVYEKIERRTFESEDREPNAIQLQSAFINYPMRTWSTLEEVIRPYYQKLNPGAREYYKRLIGEITSMFRSEDAPFMNQKLKDEYLLGYFLQRNELNKSKEDK